MIYNYMLCIMLCEQRHQNSIGLHYSAMIIAKRFDSHTGSLHQPHLAPAWMHSPQYLALAVMHSFPSGWKTKRREKRRKNQRVAAQCRQSKQPVKPPVFTHQFMWNTVWLNGNRRQRRNILSFPLSAMLSNAKVELWSMTSLR